MNHFLNWKDQVGSQAEKFYKTTLWQGEQMMVGLNCLEPGQQQKTHAHQGADKFYFVLEGRGSFIVGDEEQDAERGLAGSRAGWNSAWRRKQLGRRVYRSWSRSHHLQQK